MRERQQPRIVKWMRGFQPRLAMVVNGFLIYQSTGRNSGEFNQGTWLPFLGIDSTHWLIKPSYGLSEKTIVFCHQNRIHKKISLNRLGTDQTACLSASLGGGFWDTREGARLKNFLLAHYPHYFLNTDVMRAVHSCLLHAKPTEIYHHADFNSLLAAENPRVLLGFHRSRLPTEVECQYFENTNHLYIHAGLRTLLLNDEAISEASYQLICKLAQNPKLMTYALTSGFLECPEQVADLLKLDASQIITINDLRRLDRLNGIPLPPKYEYFLNEYPCRKVLRILREGYEERDLALMEYLYLKKWLDKYASFFMAQITYELLHELFELNAVRLSILQHARGLYKSGKLENAYDDVIETAKQRVIRDYLIEVGIFSISPSTPQMVCEDDNHLSNTNRSSH